MNKYFSQPTASIDEGAEIAENSVVEIEIADDVFYPVFCGIDQ